MKLKALNSIKHGGEFFRVGDVLDVDKKNAEYLLEVGAAVEYDGGMKAVEYDVEELLQTDDLNTLNMDQLKAICRVIGIGVSGNKGDLVAAIEAATEEIEDDETVVPE